GVVDGVVAGVVAGPLGGVVAERFAGLAGGVVYVNASAPTVGDRPYQVCTRTSTVPEPAGATAVSRVPETIRNAAGWEPNDTPETWVKSVPVTVTVVPPWAGPPAGLSAVTAGGRT